MVKIASVDVEKQTVSGCPYIGYRVKTDNAAHDVFALIENFQSCCERYGASAYMDETNTNELTHHALLLSEDDSPNMDTRLNHLREVVAGQDIVSITWKDLSTNKRIDPQTNVVVVYVSLASGTRLCLKLYNEHNGYYYHDIRLKWFDFEDNSNCL